MIKLIIYGKLISKSNEKIFNRQGRPFLSKKYKDWESDVKQQIRKQYHGQPLAGWVYLQIYYYFPDGRHSDLGNCCKGLCDALNKLVLQDDRQIQKLYQLIMPYDKQCPRTVINIHSEEKQ